MTPLTGARPGPPTWPSVAPAPRRALVVGVVAARGGAGASTLAAALARELARRTATVLVDLDRASGGIDVLLGLEGADGVRWPDLADARGEVSGADVLTLLPRWGPCAVLSADRSRPGPPEPAVVADVLHALTAAAGALVLDLDRAAVVAGESLAGACDAVLVVAPRDLRSVAGILAMRPCLVRAGVATWLVVAGPAPGGLGAAELSDTVDLPILAMLPRDRRMGAALERGGVPEGGPTARAAARVVSALGGLT
ncbi:septum site-determining protein Ssd [Cellulomonas fengjieae]|uniref:Pilus assembly protein FlpE n=1 Tax=Cellulomonas fengjieae TaxID=2819978 RepID=A0ABS3SD44_9CELL|nr:septum site-determining protein Ssd [Cellulomonas fengjieae]MBO3083414.1 pilus assembly protein FlpE [Cellulomonas fengjieae]QVI65249.1 pilus assembly protein FlpE [Cellulomonas fengjieae]